jgi:hypothetical protein
MNMRGDAIGMLVTYFSVPQPPPQTKTEEFDFLVLGCGAL